MYVLSLEVSTTSAKCILYSEEEGVISSRVKQYPASVSDGLSQDPDGVLDAAFFVLGFAAQDAAEKGIVPDGIGLAGTWHSMLLLDASYEPIGRIRTWADLFGAPAAAKARQAGHADSYYKRTGCVLHGMYPCWKIAALRDANDPGVVNARHFITQLELLYFALTGERAVSTCLASGSGLLNSKSLRWDEEALGFSGINEGQLSALVDIFHTGRLDRAAAERSGLPQGLPVSVGGADGALNQLAIGGLDNGVMSMSVGTSGALRRATGSSVTAKSPSTWCYNISEEAWIAGAAVNNATNCVDWLVSLLGGSPGDASVYDGLSLRAAEANRANAPVFLPFLFGERCPGWMEDRRGGFIGLNSQHGPGEMYYSVLEGIAFNMYQCYGILEGLLGRPTRIIVSGGITKSPMWMQLASDVFGLRLETTGSQNDSTVGAALVMLSALKGEKEIHPAEGMRPEVFVPCEASAAMLGGRYERYLQLYDATTPGRTAWR
jgi:gluconokinase